MEDDILSTFPHVPVFPRAGLCLCLGFRRETMAGGLDLEHHEYV